MTLFLCTLDGAVVCPSCPLDEKQICKNFHIVKVCFAVVTEEGSGDQKRQYWRINSRGPSPTLL